MIPSMVNKYQVWFPEKPLIGIMLIGVFSESINCALLVSNSLKQVQIPPFMLALCCWTNAVLSFVGCANVLAVA